MTLLYIYTLNISSFTK